MAEHIYLNEPGVFVSGQRITINGRTYFTSNIASVDVVMEENLLVWLLAGLLICWVVMCGMLGFWGYSFLGLLPLIAVIKWMPFRRYFLTFDTSSGRAQALRGKLDPLIGLKQVIEQAITEKDGA